MTDRRSLLKLGTFAAAGALLPRRVRAAMGGSTAHRIAKGRVLVIGGGFAGAGFARELKTIAPRVSVTLIERSHGFTACPFSNLVIAGLRNFSEQQFHYQRIAQTGVEFRFSHAVEVDPDARKVSLADGARLSYDRLVIAPGIDVNWTALPGYDSEAQERMPHAWKAGDQTLLLRRQLAAMRDGGTVVISAPPDPIRCPSAPYERASLIAHYLKLQKPRSKVLILDAKDAFAKQALFQEGWTKLYGKMVEWVPQSAGGKVISVDPDGLRLETDRGWHKADVANVIPPQQAADIAIAAGLAKRGGWCAIDSVSFESTVHPYIHVVGDSALAGALPKSAYAANEQAKACASAMARMLAGEAPRAAQLRDRCYSLVAPDYGISSGGVYEPLEGQFAEMPGSAEISPLNAAPERREEEAERAHEWFGAITAEVFG